MAHSEGRRWDIDERRRGVADAAGFTPAIDELRELATIPDWVTEDADAHLLPGLRRGAESAGLGIESWRVDEAGVLVVEMISPAERWRDLREAVWTVLGTVAEASTHVRELPRADDLDALVVFEVVTGMPPDSTEYATHGHCIRLRVARQRSSEGGDYRSP